LAYDVAPNLRSIPEAMNPSATAFATRTENPGTVLS
jgi:hypothetical protein